MKKNVICILFLSLFSCMAEGWYNRGFYNLGPLDMAKAKYEGTTKTTSIGLLNNKPFGIYVDSCNKLSKIEEELLWGALRYYDYKVGEIYSVIMSTADYRGYCDCLILYVEIQPDGNVQYVGKYCNFAVK